MVTGAGQEPRWSNCTAQLKLPKRPRLIICFQVTTSLMREEGHKPKQGWIRPPAASPGPNYLMDVALANHLKCHSRQNKGKKSKLVLLTPFIGYVFHPSSPSTDVVSSSTTEMGRRDTRAQIIINLSTHKQANFHTGNLTQSQNRHWDIFRITNDLFFL